MKKPTLFLSAGIFIFAFLLHSIAAAEDAAAKKPAGLNITRGQIVVKAAKLSRNAAPFTVKTPTAVCGVRGTEFDVVVDDTGKSQVHVMDGAVSVLNELGEVLAKAGEAIDVLKGVLPEKFAFDVGQYQEILNLWQGGITVGKVRDFVKAKIKQKAKEAVIKKLIGF